MPASGRRLAGVTMKTRRASVTDGSRALAPARLPALPLEAWRPTKDTLHLYVQVVGKVRMATTPLRNHWWNVPLYVDVRGLTTRCMRQRGLSFSIDFDLLDHELRLRTGRGEIESFPLRDGLSVADFYGQLMDLLERLGIGVAIRPEPFGVPMTSPFADDLEHASYEADVVSDWWRILDWADWVLEGFAGWFRGKTSPVHLFWHGLDLAVTRFSGRRVDPAPHADSVTQEAYGEEVISFGFWPGDDQITEPAFYSYTAPEPAGLADRPLEPREAFWAEAGSGHMALLRYDDVRAAAVPQVTLLRFLESAYQAGALAAGWDTEELRSTWCPSAGEMEVRVGR
jgi:hypothetical protein